MKKSLNLLFIVAGLVVFFSFPAFASAATYYVSTSGSDANNGTATTTPWAHHPWDANATGVSLAKSLQSGDIIVFKRGDTWYDTYLFPNVSGATSSPIISTSLSSWGSGEAVLSGAYNPASSTWSSDGGSYKTTVATQPRVVVYGSTRLTYNASATSTVALNQFGWSTANGGTLWVNVGENPTNGTTKVSKRDYVILNIKSNLTFSNLSFELSNTNAGGTVFNSGGANIIFDTVLVRYFYFAGIYQYNNIGGNQIINSTISNGGSGGTTVYGIYAYNTPGVIVTGNNVTGIITNGVFVRGSSGSIVSNNNVHDNAGTGVYVWTSNNFDISNNILTNNTTSGILAQSSNVGNIYSNSVSGTLTYFGLTSQDSNNINIYLNDIYNNTYGNYPSQGAGGNGSGGGINVTGSSSNNNVYRNNSHGNYLGIVSNASTGTGNKIYLNVVKDSTVNSIDSEGYSDYIEVYNNTIIHNPSAGNNTPYTGHALVVQGGQRAIFSNNMIDLKQVGDNCQGETISNTTSNIISVKTDYNFTHDSTSGSNANIAKLNSINYTTLSSWQSAVQADAKVLNLNGVSALAASHSQVGDPKFSNPSGSYSTTSDFQLLPTSPAIDAGTSVGLTIDYLGNPIYGTPDIGAYEYQPPFTFASNKIPTTGAARLYSDGKYRMTTASSSVALADLSISPIGGYLATTTQYLDIAINTWDTTGDQNKKWTATSTDGAFQTHATTTVYTLGDLLPNTAYTFQLDGSATSSLTGTSCSGSTCTSDGTGHLTFTYTGGYSTHIFELVKDGTAPSGLSLSSPADNSNVSNKPTLTWTSATDSESGLAKYQLFLDSSIYQDNISNSVNTYSFSNVLSCGAHSWQIKAIDNNDNIATSETRSFNAVCGGAFIPPVPPVLSATNPIAVAANVSSNNRTVIFNFNVVNAVQVAISDSPNFSNGSWLDYTPNFSYSFPSSASSGPKTLYIKFLSKDGGETAPQTISVNLGAQTPTSDIIPKPTVPNINPTKYIFKRDLKSGMTGADVKELQKYLNANGFVVAKSGAGSRGKETTLFGVATRNAIIKFQKSKKITPTVGYFGAVTRAVVNK